MCNSCNHSCHKQNTEHKHTCGDNIDNQKFIIIKLLSVFILFMLISILKPEIFFSRMLNLPENIIKFLIFFIPYIFIAKDIIINAFKNVIDKKFLDENFLMTIATFGAFAIGEYPEALMVMLLYQTGELFTDFALDKSKKSILALMNLKPEFANRITSTGIETVSPEKVKIGDVILVKPGEKVPLDGIVIEGSASIDMSNLTGESIPVPLNVEDTVSSGSINLDGVVKIKVISEFQNSTVSKIIEMVQNASNKKAKTENFITKFARVYTPFVVMLALLIAILPALIQGDFVLWFKRALTFLVISCPCALVISIPLGFFASIGVASKHGILIKGSSYIEALSRVKTVVFDKTGTLTSGVFNVSKIYPANNFSSDEFIKFAAMAEHLSTHPIARSIQSAYTGNIDSSKIKHLKEIPGLGITAQIQDINVIIGNASIMKKFNISYPENINDKTVIYMALNNKFAGYLTICDTLKTGAKDTIKSLKNKAEVDNITVLTGDSGLYGLENTEISKYIDKAYCNLLPNQKLEKLEELLLSKKTDTTLIFAGDGINDAPVLSIADIGIAMGKTGSDIAIEAADVVIMDDNLPKISSVIKISKKAINIIRQNIIFILFVKILFLSLGALGLVTMWGAVFADVGVSIIAILNSMRILNFKIY